MQTDRGFQHVRVVSGQQKNASLSMVVKNLSPLSYKKQNNWLNFGLLVRTPLLKGIVHNFFVYLSNLIFWIVMGCGIADFGRMGL